MVRAVVLFCIAYIASLLKPEQQNQLRADPEHYHLRRYTKKYRRKQHIVKMLWIGSGGLMLILQSAPGILALSLLVTFVSLMILDETS